MFDLDLTIGEARTRVVVRRDGLGTIGDLLSAALPSSSCALLITDERVGSLYAAALLESVRSRGQKIFEYLIPAGESSKSLAVVQSLYEFLAEHRAGRDAAVVALGGGVVSDVAGFVAGTWKRGVPFVACPTTMEADVDACLGGKTAINLPEGKNLVGVFHQPALIVVDPVCLRSLAPRDFRAGLAESVKHALIADPSFFEWHESNAEVVLGGDEATIRELILWNLRIKGDMVQRDPHEQRGVRVLLNFGHTIGHAIERACDFSLRHGECVSLGLVAACRLSQRIGLLDETVVRRVTALLDRFQLPTRLAQPIEPTRVIDAMGQDKKIEAGRLRFVLLEDLGRPIVRSSVTEESVRLVVDSLLV